MGVYFLCIFTRQQEQPTLSFLISKALRVCNVSMKTSYVLNIGASPFLHT